MLNIRQILIKSINDNVVCFDVIIDCLILNAKTKEDLGEDLCTSFTFLFPDITGKFNVSQSGHKKIILNSLNGAQHQIASFWLKDVFVNKINGLLNNPDILTGL